MFRHALCYFATIGRQRGSCDGSSLASAKTVCSTRRCTFPAETTAVDSALQRAQTALLDKQNAKGYWVGELQGDSILESEYCC